MLTKMSIKSLQTILLHTAMQNILASIFCFTSLKSTCLWYHKALYIQVHWPPMKVKEASGWSQEKSDVHILFTAILLDRKLINVVQQDASVGCIACNAEITTNLKKTQTCMILQVLQFQIQVHGMNRCFLQFFLVGMSGNFEINAFSTWRGAAPLLHKTSKSTFRDVRSFRPSLCQVIQTLR